MKGLFFRSSCRASRLSGQFNLHEGPVKQPPGRQEAKRMIRGSRADSSGESESRLPTTASSRSRTANMTVKVMTAPGQIGQGREETDEDLLGQQDLVSRDTARQGER